MKDPELNIGGVSEAKYNLDSSLKPDQSERSKKDAGKDFNIDLNTSLSRLDKKKRSKTDLESAGMWESITSMFGRIPAPQAYAYSSGPLAEMDNKVSINAENSSSKGAPAAVSGSSDPSMGHQSKNTAPQPAKTSDTSSMLEQLFAAGITSAPYGGLIPMSNFMNGLARASRLSSIELIAGQIVESAKLLKVNGKSELTVDIKPDLLGNLKLNLKEVNGMISIQIFASSTAKDLLDTNLAELKQALASANIAVGGLEVFVGGNNKDRETEDDMDSAVAPLTGSFISSASPQAAAPIDRLFLEQKLGYAASNVQFNIWS